MSGTDDVDAVDGTDTEDAHNAMQQKSPSRSDKRVSTTGAFADILGTEPADPEYVAHDARRSSRLFHPHLSTENVPAPLWECGCGDCPPRYDPLADEPDGAFADILTRNEYAADNCPNPVP